MRMMTMIVVALTLCSAKACADVPQGYELQSIQGFTVLIHESVLRQPADRWQRKPLDVLDQEFADLKRVIGVKSLPYIQQVPVWVSWDTIDRSAPGVVAVYYGGTNKELERLTPQKVNCIEILTLRRLGELRPPGSRFQQVITLHEMAHAYQHRLLGMDAPEVKAAFKQAVDRKLYDNVADRNHRLGRAYARTNEAEYFAELSCAFLDTCHYYPHTYNDLREHDPAGFALMEAVWKKPEQFAGRAKAVPTAAFFSSEVVAKKTSTQTEVAAHIQLDAARVLLRNGESADAKRRLESIVASYPDTYAAANARKLLERLR